MKNKVRDKIKEKSLKVTPQRVAILESIYQLKNHPTAEDIHEYIKQDHPNISLGTVYKVLDIFVENNLIKKVKTEKDIMRYDHHVDAHHHLYCYDSERIEDYEDKELNKILDEYFQKKKIKNFQIKDVKLQITGSFRK